MPIGAILVSPEISEVIYSQSNKLGKLVLSFPIKTQFCAIAKYYMLILSSKLHWFITGSFSHGFTYSGHPVSCAVALEALKIYK